jgi:hypothetical protein
LRARRQRTCDRHAAEQRDERAPFHSITSSARASSVGAEAHWRWRGKRLDPERLKEIVARYIDPTAENAIEVSPTAEPADVIDPDDCDGVVVG